jgi:hypothetical protein
MAYAKIEYDLFRHPKVEAIAPRARPLAVALYVGMLCYSSEHLTDGLISRSAVSEIASALGVLRPRRALDELVRVRLIVRSVVPPVPVSDATVARSVPSSEGYSGSAEPLQRAQSGAFSIPDYLDFHRSREEVMGERKRDRERKKRTRGQQAFEFVPPGQEEVSARTSSRTTRAHDPGRRDRDRDSSKATVSTKPAPETPNAGLPFHLELLIAEAQAENASADTIRREAEGLPEAVIARTREALRDRRPRPDVPAAYVVATLRRLRSTAAVEAVDPEPEL